MTEQKKDSTSGSAQTRPTDAFASYVVQIATFEGADEIATWEDIAVVEVPPRTHRRTVIERAVKDNAGMFDKERRIRVIPLEFAKPVTVTMEQPPPQLRIGT